VCRRDPFRPVQSLPGRPSTYTDRTAYAGGSSRLERRGLVRICTHTHTHAAWIMKEQGQLERTRTNLDRDPWTAYRRHTAFV